MIVFRILTHVLITLQLFVLLNLPFNAAVVIAVIIGSTLPDMDNFITYVGRLTNNSKLSEYRTVTHSMLGIACTGILSLILFPSYIGCAVLFGYCIHLISDLFYIEGCTLLYPFKKERRTLVPIKFKFAEEFIFNIVFLSILIFYLSHK